MVLCGPFGAYIQNPMSLPNMSRVSKILTVAAVVIRGFVGLQGPEANREPQPEELLYLFIYIYTYVYVYIYIYTCIYTYILHIQCTIYDISYNTEYMYIYICVYIYILRTTCR